MQELSFTLNNKEVKLTLDGERKLLWVLRTELGLTGTKYGCGMGICGACTVLVEGQPVKSCVFPVKNIQGKKILTIEGLAENGRLHPIQQAFMKHNSLQCGFCTPGMILKAYALLQENPMPTREDIITSMDSNLCRCGTYNRVVQAIQSAAQDMRGGGR